MDDRRLPYPGVNCTVEQWFTGQALPAGVVPLEDWLDENLFDGLGVLDLHSKYDSTVLDWKSESEINRLCRLPFPADALEVE